MRACCSAPGRALSLSLAFTLTAVLIPPPAAAAPSSPAPRETVFVWNQLLADTVAIAGQQPPTVRVERSYAMLHLAMFDAVNSVLKVYTPGHVQVPAPRGASPVAAAAQAARDVLAALYPGQTSVYDAALAQALAGIPGGRARRGRLVGAAVAQAILDWRSTDGWALPPPPYTLAPLPGAWQPTPTGFRPAAFTNYPGVAPFVVESFTQFLPPPPPSLTSAAYTSAFNEAKAFGAAASTVRTPDQTLTALLYAGVGTRATPNTLWNGVARDAARAARLDLLQTARLFALLNATFHDALGTSFSSKYTYGLWRPVTAIVRADEDLNPDTAADPSWTPLLTTPPYPTYAGNAAALSAASARILARFFGTDDLPFDVFFEGTTTPGWKRFFPGFWAFADEQARSRIYGGIHFSFDSTASQAMAVDLADWVFDRYLTPR